MPKKKKRGFQKKKKDDSPGDASDCESLERLPSSKKVAAASSTSQLEDDDQISSFTRISLNSSKSESGETAGLSSSHFFCNYCEFSAESKSVLLGHTRQHMIKCPHCSFSSLSRIEVSRHCKHEHEEDPEGVSQEVGSSSADCEMDKDPCTACVFCSFLTYSTEHLENHTLHKHPGMLAKSVARMITKQSSTEVRRDDAVFYLSISNGGLGKSSNLMAPEKSSSPIVIDPVVSKSEDIKPEIKCSYSKSVSILQRTGRLPVENKFENNRCDAVTGDKLANRNTPAKAESSGVPMQVKVESLYCLTCPYSSAYIEKLKCHTLAQHPVGPAVATYNTNCVDAEDIVFFCVREDCSHSSSDSMSFQKHLMNCCSCQQTLKVLEKERLKSTVTYVLEHQKKHHLPAADGFFDFTSLFPDVCLPPSLTGISSSVSAETQSVNQRGAERSLNMPQSSAVYTAKASVDNSPVATGLYRAPSHLSSTTVSSSGSPSTESNSSKSSQMFFPQQVQSGAQNIQSTANSAGDYQKQMAHNSVMLPAQADCFPRNLSTDGRSLQPVQSHNVAFYPQSQGNCPQPASANPQTASANSLLASYPDTPQATAGWQTGQVQATGLPSAPVQSEHNYRNTFLIQNSDANMTGLRTQNNTTYNPLSQSQSDTFSVEQDYEMNQSFRPAASHSYAPSPGQFSQPPASGSNLHINNTNSSFPGHPSETSASNISNVLMTSGVTTVSNSMTSNVFYGQQNSVSSGPNTIDMDQSSVETQSPPKMVDLLSDSYSILLSDEFGPDGQIQQVNDNNSFIQTPHMPVCNPQYQSEATLSTHNQVQVSQSPMPQGQPIPYQAMQHEGSRFQPLAVDDSQMPAGNQFSYPVSNQNNQISMAGSTRQNPDFQTVQNPSNYGALQNALSQNSSNFGSLQSSFPSEDSSNAQPAPFQSSEVPNFLVSPGTTSSEMRPMQPHPANSFGNRHPGAGQPVIGHPGTGQPAVGHQGAGQPAVGHPGAGQPAVGHPGTFTPPKNSQPGNKFASPSPLSPSIYLSGQVPRHRRSNWTDADMSPRGMMMSSGSPRHVHPPVSAPGSHSFMSQRQSVPGIRGYARGPRMSSVRGRMPTPRMPYSQAGGGGDDDDVILTAVVRGTPPKNQQPHQQPGGRGTYRGAPSPASRGRGQALPIQNRQRNLNSAPRVPYPVAIPPPQTHKQFDISKHFEDLACVVNASADDAEGDIQIVAVTPGKDKDKMNQPKAVDASKFSFCCVHCGKDQGSKTVMKQHMKARHNDSLLGAFTNTETGQLLFFCPQQACEFMTYDEKRLSEHLSKCFDLDRSKPFDFGTAIKNLKSLKIRQLDVRTMGRSQEFAIDLDGQGMKDNFSSSLNDAFGDIVVNASGRHMLRNAPPHQARLSQQQFQSAPPPSAAVASKSPVRHLPPSNMAPRLSNPRFIQPGNLGNRMHRPMASPRYAKQPSYEMRPQLRQTGPMDVRNFRDMRPRAPSSAVHRQPMPMRAAPLQNISTPRMPNRSQQEPVIVIDVDSPERPEEGQESMIIDSPENIHQLPLVSSDQSPSSSLLEARPQNIVSYPEMMNADSCSEQQPVSDNAGLVPGHSTSASPNLFPGSRLSHDSRLSDRTHPSQLSSMVDQSVCYSYDGNNTADEAPESDEDHLQQNSVSLSGMLTRNSNSAALSSSQEDEPNSECDPDRPAVDSNASVAGGVMRTPSCSREYAPTPSYVETANVRSHATDGIQTYPSSSSSSSSSTPIPPTNDYFNVEPVEECLDEEEKVNALVLEKVFAKVPNMPKNLSRRLVAKFKEYAKHRGVKITTDSKVIDEFVSKIYYKGSAGDKTASRPQPPPDAPQFQPAESPHVSTSTPLAPPVSNSSIPSSENTQPPQRDYDYESPKEYPDYNTDTVQEDLQPKEYAHGEPAVAEYPSFSEQSSANDVVATHVILAEKTLHFSPTFASIAMKSSVASTKILESRHRVGVEQKNTDTNERLPAESSDSVLKSHVDTANTTVINRRNSLSDWPLPTSVATLRRSGSLPQIAFTFPASPRATRLPLEHIQEDSTAEASSVPVFSTDVNESSEDRQAVAPEDCEGDADVNESSEDRQNVSNEDWESNADVNESLEDRRAVPLEDCESDADVNESLEDRRAVPLEDCESDADVNESLEDRQAVCHEDWESNAGVNESLEDRQAVSHEDCESNAGVNESLEDRQAVSHEDCESNTDVNESLEDRQAVSHEDCESNTDVNESLEDRQAISHEDCESNTDVNESLEDRQAVSHEDCESNTDVNESSKDRQAVSNEDCEANALEPAAETGEEHTPSLTVKKQLKEEVEIPFPPAPEAETVPILITSSVADIVSGHPGLEVDIAGKPLKQEFLDEDDRDMDDVGQVEDSDISKSRQGCDMSPKEDIFEKVTPKSSNFIDRKTGQLLLKKTKRGRPRKLFAEKEEPRKLFAAKEKPRKMSVETEKPVKMSVETEKPVKMSVETEKPGKLCAEKEEKQEEESKDFEAEEEHIVRRSSRSRKPVNKDYRSDANEIDELMSDDDDEYFISEDDYDTDTDGDWRGGDSDQPPKKRIKKVRPPPDPTAFDISTKGKFKCWLCKKVFSRCTFAKSHLVQKHKEGLCAVYVDKSEESKSLCLLVFCPRKCRYVTLSLEGLMNHVENCAETELEADGKPYLEINKGFLDNKYTELQGMSLEAVMSIPKARKPKDPTKSPKGKKSVSMNKSTAAAAVIIHHSEALVTIKVESEAPSTAPSVVSSSSPMDTSPVTQQTVTSHRSHTAAHGLAHPPPAIRSPTATDQCTLITSKKNCFLPQKPSQYSSPQPTASQHSSSVVIDMTSTHFHPAMGSPVSSAAPAAYKHSPGQQMLSSSGQNRPGSSSFPQSAVPRMSSIGFSTSEQVKGDSSFPQSIVPRMSNIGFSTSEQGKGDSSFPHSTVPRMSNIGFSTSEQVKGDSLFSHSAVPRMSNIGFNASEQIKTNSSFPQPASNRVSNTSFSMSEHMKGGSFSPHHGPSRMSNTGLSSSEQIKTSSSFSQPASPRVFNTGYNMSEQLKGGSFSPQPGPPRTSNIGFNMSEQLKGGNFSPQPGPPRTSNIGFNTSEQLKGGSSFPLSGPPRMSNAGFSMSRQVKGGSSFPQPGPPRMSNIGFSMSEQVKGDSSFLHSGPAMVSDTSFSADQEDDIVYMIEDNGTICLK